MNMPDRDWMMWWGGRLRRHANLPLWLAALLLAATLGLYAVATHLEGDAAGQALRPRQQIPVVAQEAVRADTNEAAMADFYGTLPALATVPDILGKVFALGGHHGVGLAQGDYRLDPAEGGIIRCHMRFPVTGDTSKLEMFVRAALKAFPALALEGVSFQRRSADRSDSEAEIRFTLFLRADSDADVSASGASR
ncbi:MAG: hypothetical protein K0Q68_202 [Moraxellaceae bacterium]|jgi:hypothetical protein|nr:hypothetical protein [Moraxellaceae bacterium]